MNLRSTNVPTIQDTLCIKDLCELYLRICINLLSHMWISEQLNDLIYF